METKNGGMSRGSVRRLIAGCLVGVFLYCPVRRVYGQQAKRRRFEAVGVTKPVKLQPEKFGMKKKAAVEVYFDLLPASMRFHLPSFPCMVTENNIRYSNFWAETYEPRIRGGSFEPMMDRDHKYARMWIESQNDARIIVRVRGALCDSKGNIAHSDIPSGSPYGKGDWVDEWYCIYPDGIHVRHVKIYTGLASRSRPFGFDREPPAVLHEFMEAAVLGAPGHLPTDDIETKALTLIRLIGGHSENRIPGGQSKTISYKPYPKDFGDFRDANIMVANLKSRFKPFTIAMPYGCRIQPYQGGGRLPHTFIVWGKPPKEGYATPFGHILNFWHYRRTNNTLEQVYLTGMTDAADPAKVLVPLAWSWIAPAKLRMAGLEGGYDTFTYDASQRAYTLTCKKAASRLEFRLAAGRNNPVVNPGFVVKGWGGADVALTIDGKEIKRGRDFRIGHEKADKSTNLVLWVKMESTRPVKMTLTPVAN